MLKYKRVFKVKKMKILPKPIKIQYKDREPCSVGCLNHVTHPCEKCGRLQGKGNYYILVILESK